MKDRIEFGTRDAPVSRRTHARATKVGNMANGELFKKLVADAQIDQETIGVADIGNYFLSNGLDHPGQVQVGILGKGYGIEASISANFVLASVDAGAAVTKLTRRVMVAQHGPRRIGPEVIPAPLALISMTGSVWKAAARASVFLGVNFEFEAKLADNKLKTETDHSFKKKDTTRTAALEIVGASISASAGLGLSAGGQTEHYWGYDPMPVYFVPGDKDKLRAWIGETIMSDSREAAVKTRALTLFNEVRDIIIKQFPKDKSERTSWKKALGVYFESVNDLNMAELTQLTLDQCIVAAQAIKDWASTNDRPDWIREKAKSGNFLERASELHWRLTSQQVKVLEPVCWLRMHSAQMEMTGSVGAQASAAAGVLGASADLSVTASLVKGRSAFRRAGSRWQTPLLSTKTGTLFCTQETSITYSSLDVEALALAVNANATGGTKAANYSGGGAVAKKVLNAMNYSSATLYWKRGKDFSSDKQITDFAPPLAGSGVSFGLSVVVTNLWTAIEDIENSIKSEWLATTACLLNVTYKELSSFLNQGLVGNLIEDLRNCPPSQAQTESWADRSVLIEASFALDNSKCTYIDVVEGVPKEFLQEMLKARGKLQCFRLRFRIADRREVTKSWGLGFKIAGIGIGVSVLGIDNAAAEGIVDLCTSWVKSQDNAGGLIFSTVPPENGVPPVTLFCQ